MTFVRRPRSFQPVRQPGDVFDERGIEQRTPRLERVRHRAAIGLDQQIVRQVSREIRVQQPAERRQPLARDRLLASEMPHSRRPAAMPQTRRAAADPAEIVLKQAVPAREPFEQRQRHDRAKRRARAKQMPFVRRRCGSARSDAYAAPARAPRGTRSAASAAAKRR